MPAYVDTSALVKRYIAEVGSAWVRQFLAHPAQYVIYTAALAKAEVISALQRRVRDGSLALPQAQRLTQRVTVHFAQRYKVLALTQPLIDQACGVLQAHPLLARWIGASPQDLELAATPTLAQVKEIAAAQRSTVVEYSILYGYDPDLPLEFSDYTQIPATDILAWVIKLSGEIAFHRTRLDPPLLLADLVRSAREGEAWAAHIDRP